MLNPRLSPTTTRHVENGAAEPISKNRDSYKEAAFTAAVGRAVSEGPKGPELEASTSSSLQRGFRSIR